MIKDRRYYLAVDIAQYIIEGHSKREASQEFKVANRTIDGYLDSLQSSNEVLYLKTMKALDQHRCSRSFKVCTYIANGHSKSQASNYFDLPPYIINQCIGTIKERNYSLYRKVIAGLKANPD